MFRKLRAGKRRLSQAAPAKQGATRSSTWLTTSTARPCGSGSIPGSGLNLLSVKVIQSSPGHCTDNAGGHPSEAGRRVGGAGIEPGNRPAQWTPNGFRGFQGARSPEPA